jgi:predicted Zn-ribbon and HTH transcriptional regulator
MTEPHPPPDRLQSSRELLLQTLSTEPLTVRALSRAACLSERDVLNHMQHLQKSLKAQNGRLVMMPATCLDCHFVFKRRERLARPGKCPVCHSTHMSEPLFSIEKQIKDS